MVYNGAVLFYVSSNKRIQLSGTRGRRGACGARCMEQSPLSA
jgi:hypothetical protein